MRGQTNDPSTCVEGSAFPLLKDNQTDHIPARPGTMASQVDYNALRAQTIGAGLDEEAVTVNTRALIDKVLARYSGEWYESLEFDKQVIKLISTGLC